MHVGDEAIVKGTQKNRIKISASHVIALDDWWMMISKGIFSNIYYMKFIFVLFNFLFLMIWFLKDDEMKD